MADIGSVQPVQAVASFMECQCMIAILTNYLNTAFSSMRRLPALITWLSAVPKS